MAQQSRRRTQQKPKADQPEEPQETVTEQQTPEEEASQEAPAADQVEAGEGDGGAAAPDLSKFLTGETAPAAAVQQESQTEEPAPAPEVTGTTRRSGNGRSEAVVVKGAFQLRTPEGRRVVARKGEKVVATAEKIDRGVAAGILARL